MTRDAVQGISDRGVARSRLDHGGLDPLDGPHRRARHRLARRRPVRPVLRSDRWHPRAGLESGAQPETAIVKTSHLVLDPATGGPVVDQYGRCSDPAYFAAGNVLRPVEASWTVWREGRDVARAVAASLRGNLPQATHIAVLETQGPVRYVCPQRVAFPAPIPAALPINIRVSRPARGRLRVLDGAREVWGEGRRLLPERRVILPFAAHVAEHAERLAIDIDETVATG